MHSRWSHEHISTHVHWLAWKKLRRRATYISHLSPLKLTRPTTRVIIRQQSILHEYHNNWCIRFHSFQLHLLWCAQEREELWWAARRCVLQLVAYRTFTLVWSRKGILLFNTIAKLLYICTQINKYSNSSTSWWASFAFISFSQQLLNISYLIFSVFFFLFLLSDLIQ